MGFVDRLVEEIKNSTNIETWEANDLKEVSSEAIRKV